ncbi:MAG: amidase [Paracoccaceae bacterium]|nr:amidase [Paracoccaceae bacterium]
MSAMIAAGDISSVELTTAHVKRIERLNPVYRAFVLPTFEIALEMAREADEEISRGRRRGPLQGIPIALKDAFDTAGIPTTVCSRLYADRVPDRDAFAWARLKDAGAVLLGKLECAELCLGGPSKDSMAPNATNPWDKGRYAGGSSSGAGVSLATGMVPGALGSDTGGSIRIPASFCGVAGLKPTYGLVSLSGLFPLAGSLDHAGPMGRTSEDCALLLDAIAGYDPADPVCVPSAQLKTAPTLTEDLTGAKIGYVRQFAEHPAVSEEVRAATEQALKVMADLGAEVREVSMPDIMEFTACNSIIMMSEAFAVHGANLRNRASEVSEMSRKRITLGAFIRAEDYVRAQMKRRELARATAKAMKTVDVLVYPAALGDPPKLEEIEPFYYLDSPLITAPANVAGIPAASVRAGMSRAGLPMGIQITGRLFGDADVLRIAHAYERATPEFNQTALTEA